MNMTIKFTFLLCIFIFFTEIIHAQDYYILHHRYGLIRDMNGPPDPELFVEVSKPKYFPSDTTIVSDFIHHPFSGWQPNNYMEAIGCLETDTVTLMSNTTTINFAFGFQFIDIDSIVNPDSLLRVQYQIIDVDSPICNNFALETQVFNPFFIRDSFSDYIYAVYSIQGNRTHTFSSYPGQRVISAVDLNWSAIKDSVDFLYGMGEIYYHSSSYQNSNFVTNQLPLTLNNTISKIPEPKILPISIKLEQNYPNPFNLSTTIHFYIERARKVDLAIYNTLGQKVKTLFPGNLAPGDHIISWDGNDETGNVVASGVYIYRLQSDGFTENRKMMFLK